MSIQPTTTLTRHPPEVIEAALAFGRPEHCDVPVDEIRRANRTWASSVLARHFPGYAGDDRRALKVLADTLSGAEAEIAELRGAIEMGQGNCDAEYNRLKKEHNLARLEWGGRLVAIRQRADKAEAELAQNRADKENYYREYKRAAQQATNTAKEALERMEKAEAELEACRLVAAQDKENYQCATAASRAVEKKISEDLLTERQLREKAEAENAELRRDRERLELLISLFNEYGQIDSIDFQVPLDRATIDAAREAGKGDVK